MTLRIPDDLHCRRFPDSDATDGISFSLFLSFANFRRVCSLVVSGATRECECRTLFGFLQRGAGGSGGNGGCAKRPPDDEKGLLLLFMRACNEEGREGSLQYTYRNSQLSLSERWAAYKAQTLVVVVLGSLTRRRQRNIAKSSAGSGNRNSKLVALPLSLSLFLSLSLLRSRFYVFLEQKECGSAAAATNYLREKHTHIKKQQRG